MKIAVYINALGQLCLVRPAYDSPQRPEGLTDNQFLDFIIRKDIPNDRPATIVNNEDLPDDLANRDNWELRDGRVVDPG